MIWFYPIILWSTLSVMLWKSATPLSLQLASYHSFSGYSSHCCLKGQQCASYLAIGLVTFFSRNSFWPYILPQGFELKTIMSATQLSVSLTLIMVTLFLHWDPGCFGGDRTSWSIKYNLNGSLLQVSCLYIEVCSLINWKLVSNVHPHGQNNIFHCRYKRLRGVGKGWKIKEICKELICWIDPLTMT